MQKNDEIIQTVGVLIIKDAKVLLVKHGKSAGHLTGTYGLPAGRIEKNEGERVAAIRELQEETGLITSERELIEYPGDVYTATIERKDSVPKTYAMKVFQCRNYSGELKSSDETTPEWVEIEKLDSYKLLPNVEEIVLKETRW